MSSITVKELILTLQQMVAVDPLLEDVVVLIDEAHREAHNIKDIDICLDMVECLDEQQHVFAAVLIRSTYWDNLQ